MADLLDRRAESITSRLTTKPGPDEQGRIAVHIAATLLGATANAKTVMIFWRIGRRPWALVLVALSLFSIALNAVSYASIHRLRARGLLQRSTPSSSTGSNTDPITTDDIRGMLYRTIREAREREQERKAQFDPNSVDLGVRKTDERGFVDPTV